MHADETAATDGCRSNRGGGDMTNGDDGIVVTERMEFMLMLRRRGIGDKAVLRAMDAVPRDAFVSADDAAYAHADRALPIDCGQTISQPYVVAYMTEQLRLGPESRVLEIGTGSGYQTAILAQLAREVVTVERYRTLSDGARKRLGDLGCENVVFVVGDGISGHSEAAPYDRILVTAAAATVPETLAAQLADGGIMILPLGPQDEVQHLVKLTRSGENFARETLLPVRFVPLLPGQAREL
jgi:protein-L-isoaspartate(D-aspartate) O-methyltransferase